ncbi:cupin domain-containing protein [Halobacillus massiliensis]|uniref:cupin domain-containing protein n=1 Tax=Halobacillus massiliensis TaxID=1926286 RepID=UPI0009E41AB3|nr:cupin domain-containing protein [Halobacillus massiliensis]
MGTVLSDLPNKKLVHPDGRKITFLDHGVDRDGEYLLLEHRVPCPKMLSGPHWHPLLTETFRIKEGELKIVVDKKEEILGSGDQLTVYPKQVHHFRNEEDSELIITHRIQPPRNNWKIFSLIHHLECNGKLSKKGIPKDPLWLGLAWEYMDGYLSGPPLLLQKCVLGGLAKAAGKAGCKTWI